MAVRLLTCLLPKNASVAPAEPARRWVSRLQTARWLPILLGLGVAAATLGLWRVLAAALPAPLPQATLAGGLFLAALLAFAVWLAQTAWARAETAARTNRELLAELLEYFTARKILEREVANRNREVAKTQALAVMGQAASMIAHDLRNPLSTIKMSLQIVGKRLDKSSLETEREINRIALEQVRYMEEVLSDLLTYSRPDALVLEWLMIDRLLDDAILSAQKEIAEHRAMVGTYYQPGLPTFHGDANKLRQVFCNLITNAVQANESKAHEAGRVEIYTRLWLEQDLPAIRVEICDDGRGIAPELLDCVFEPFFTTRARGTGLGLAIAKRIIDQHHGSIRLQPRVEGGTRVIVLLSLGPLRDAP